MKPLTFITVLLLASLILSCKVMRTTNLNLPAKEIPHNADLLSIQEVDNGTDTILLKQDYKVVDPNGSLIVTLNGDALSDNLASSQLSAAISERLEKLKDMLAQEPTALQNLSDAIVAYNKDPRSKDWQTLLERERPFARLILLDKNSRKLYTASVPHNASIQTQYEYLFKTASMLISQIETQITQEAKTNGIYLQLGAWIGNNGSQSPIHIPGYDDYSSQPSYTVERFQYTLTQEQKNELNDIAGLAQKANQQGLGAALMSTIKDSGLLKSIDSLPSVRLALGLESQLETLLKNSDSSLSTLEVPAKNCYLALQDFSGFVSAAIQSFKIVSDTAGAEQLLLKVNDDMDELTSKLADLKATLSTNAKSILTATGVAVNTATTQLKQIASAFNTLTDSLQSEFSGFKTNIGGMLSALISGKHLAQESYDFSDKVRKLSIDQLPKTAVIDLQTAGKRSEGDVVTIKLATGKLAAPVVEQALVQYHLYFCSVYARTATGFLFVNQVPIFKAVNNSALFRYAASYSILLKGFWKGPEGSRTHLAYHTLWSPGIGLNFSTLTFNPNGSTELGIGGVVTLLQDFVQVGCGVNTFSGAGYVFFGFKIPIGSFSLH